MSRVPHPSHKALLVLVGTVFVVSFIVVWTLVSQSQELKREINNAIGVISPISVSRDPNLAKEQDADSDGLLDWEESLRGSNPKNPDSDNDGTSDGDEVANGRDPMIAGPNDSIADQFSSSSAALAAELEAARRPGTLTDDFAELFAEKFVAAQASGGFDKATEDALVANLSGTITTKSSSPDKYSALSVLTSQNVSLSSYANWFAETHGDTFNSLASIKDDADSATLTGQTFIQLGRELCSEAIPPTLASLQAEVCSINDKLGEGLVSLGKAETDPVRTIAGIAMLREAEARRLSVYTSIANYLERNGVSLLNSKYPGFWASVTL